ncbi:MAG: hypothetical protein E7179_05465 [Erysipelotrichaceae bacterium]|jgi:hypothetical protein|nr:hypothetical protein [Erysipelotrichaceae bacterium]
MIVAALIGNLLSIAGIICGMLSIHFASGISLPIDLVAYWNNFIGKLGFGVMDADHLVPTIGLIVLGILFLVEFLAALNVVARLRRVGSGVVWILIALANVAFAGFLLMVYSFLPRPIELVPSILIYASFPLMFAGTAIRTAINFKY